MKEDTKAIFREVSDTQKPKDLIFEITEKIKALAAQQLRPVTDEQSRLAMRTLTLSFLSAVLAVACLGDPVFATSNEPLWLYCEATRVDDGARVSYTFRIENGVAHSRYGRWEVRNSERELRLIYIHEDGRRDEGAFIIIDRFTGELFHNAYNISIYRTQGDDRPCQQTAQRF